MPSKSQRKKKRSLSGKKKKGRRSTVGAVAQQQVDTQTPEPIAPLKVATPPPSASVPAQMPESAAVQHPYILAELRRIGILAGIILAILVVLVLVLP